MYFKYHIIFLVAILSTWITTPPLRADNSASVTVYDPFKLHLAQNGDQFVNTSPTYQTLSQPDTPGHSCDHKGNGDPNHCNDADSTPVPPNVTVPPADNPTPAPQPEPVTNEPESQTAPVIVPSESEPAMTQPEPESQTAPVIVPSESEPAITQPELKPVTTSSEPEPVMTQPELAPVVIPSESEPVMTQPEPSFEPQPMTTEPVPVSAPSEPVFQPVPSQPDSLSTPVVTLTPITEHQPESAMGSPSPTVEAPPSEIEPIIPPTASVCPETGILMENCRGQQRVLTHVTIRPGISISQVTLAGTITNQGWISNATILPDATLKGGNLTETIYNQGIISDIAFRGKILTGGFLSGQITVQKGSVLENVTLLPHTNLQGGTLNNAQVMEGVTLTNVILGEGTQLSNRVIIGSDVHFANNQQIPVGIDLTSAFSVWFTESPKLLNLHREVVSGPVPTLLQQINQIPDLQNNHWQFGQDQVTGQLQLMLEGVRFALLPVQVRQVGPDLPVGMTIHADDSIRFVTSYGREIVAQPMIQDLAAFRHALGVEEAEVQVTKEGVVQVKQRDNTWNAYRASVESNVVAGEQSLGLFEATDQLNAQKLVFLDETGQKWEQLIHSTCAYPEAWQAYQASLPKDTQPFVFEGNGTVSVTVDGERYRGVCESAVTAADTQNSDASGKQGKNGLLSFVKTKDGKGWVVMYPSGEQQIFQAVSVTDPPPEEELISTYGGCQAKQLVSEETSTATTATEVFSPTATLTRVLPKQTKKIVHDEATLEISQTALTEEKTLSIKSLRDRDLPPLDSGMTNVTKGPRKAYRFLPHHTQFTADVQVRIPYDKQSLPFWAKETDVTTFYFDDKGCKWVPLEKVTVDTKTQEVVSKTNHFTDMINSVVTTPDSPTTSSYVPTQFKDMKAADPATGINLIEPPQANNMGTVNLSYPIEVPPGRVGMQPQVTLTYHSGSGNGWVGMGWDLPMPAITVETTWGVPHYYGDKESENYRLNSELLMPVVHRHDLQPRTAEKVFFPRVISQFQRIIRHGNHPSRYWWEVTDKDGKVSYYGGDPTTSGPVPDSTLTDANGNVFSWALREVKDLNGNNIQYRGKRVSSQVGFVSGVDLYLDTINYTGFNGQAGPYQVKFLRNSGRADAISSGRGGFMRVTGDVLQRVEVTYQGQMIRSYELKYQSGPFSKTQLISVTQFGETGEAFNTHTFEYYDDISGTPGFAPMTFWDSGNDLGQNSAISVTQGSEKGKSMSINAGLSAPVVGSVLSFGRSKSSSKSHSEGLLVLADINADGLPDKVFKRGNLVYYRPNLSGPYGTWQFGYPKLIANLPEISKESSSSQTKGKSFSVLVVSGGSSKTKTKTEQPVYFIDRNGDGLLDLAYNGTVLFNHRDTHGEHYFSPNSADTPYPLGIADAAKPLTTEELGMINSISDSLAQEYAAALQEFQENSPLVDTVRRWQVPFDGQVSIMGTVALIQDSSAERQSYTTADGVRVAIQLNDNELWTTQIAATDYAAKSPTGVDSLTVKKGDVIYFRVQSNDDGAYDQVQWNPIIQYVNIPTTLDANQFDVSRYDATKDFTFNSGYQGTFVDVPYSGKVQLTGELKKTGTTSDEVTLEVLKNGEVIDTQTLASNETGTLVLKQDLDVVAKDRLMVHVKIDSPIDLSTLQWVTTHLPVMSYLSSEDPEIEQPVMDVEGKPLYRYAAVSSYDVYPLTNLTMPLEAWTVPQSGTYTVESLLAMTLGEMTADSSLTLTVKRAGQLVAKQILNVINNVVDNIPITIQATQGEKLYFEVNTLNSELLTKLSQINVAVAAPDGSSLSVPVALNSAEAGQMIAPAYRGWSVFGYGGNGERATMPITITATDLSGEELATQTGVLQDKYAEFAKKAEAIQDEATLEALQDEMDALLEEEAALKKQFVIMPFLPDVETQMWQGSDEGTWVKAETMSSSRDGLDHLDVPEPAAALASLDPVAVAQMGSPAGGGSQSLTPEGVPDFVGAMSISRTSRCESKTKSLGIGLGKLSASKTKTKSKCYGEDDMMDFNGDSFPDMLHVWGVQFTTMSGILGGQILPWHVDGIRHTYAVSKSKGMGGSTPKIGANSKGRTDNNACSAPGISGSINLTASVSANKSKGVSDIKWDLLDVNGDGLIDRLDSDGTLIVAYNIGYNFVGPEFLGSADINKGQNSSFDVGGGVEIGGGFGPISGSIGGGVSVGSSQSSSVRSLADVNGDGTLDIVWAEGGGLRVMFNTGSTFTAPVVWMTPGLSVSRGSNRGAYLSASVSVGFPVGTPLLNFGVGVSGSMSTSQNRNDQVIQLSSDLNGDGYPDVLLSDSEGNIQVGLSQIRRTHLLKAVHNPLGGSFTVDYDRTGNTYAQPHNRWVMSSVTIDDGHAGDGVDQQVTTYQYLDGFYNRLERDFYGFKTVVETDLDEKGQGYRSTTRTFLNDSYYNKGLVVLETMTDAAGKKWVETENTYFLRDVATHNELANLNDLTAVVFPELRRTDKRFFEGQATAGKATYETYQYDAVGNVVGYFNAQEVGTVDDIQAEITYFSDTGKYLFVPQSIVVTANGQVMRKREATIDGSTGDVKQVRQYLANGQVAVADMEYDQYGNIRRMTGPSNHKGQRYALKYTYDPAVVTYNTRVVDSFGYTSSARYHLKYGKPEETIDINNQSIQSGFDAFGRIQTITGPYQIGQAGGYTLRFSYHPEARPAWALTQHIDVYRDVNDPLETVLFVDGLKRVIQTKKDATVHVGENGTAKDVMTVSGPVKYDFVGRAVAQSYPTTEALGQPGTFNIGKDSIPPTLMTYDVLDRTLCTTIPDHTQTCTSYGFGNDRGGQLQFLTRVTDAHGKVKESYRDLREVITAVKEFNQGQPLWTSYEYDALKQILKVWDDKNNLTEATYDNLGRRLSLNNPDMGLVEWVYDLAGHVTKKVTANLRAQGGAVVYDYDYTRLSRIRYPQYPENNVTYTYGAPGASDNRANRVVTVTDESGKEERFYGRLGEVIKTIKTVASDTQGKSSNSPEVYTTLFEYDTWNRLQKLTYPDGEVLTHLYDAGGLLRALSGSKSGRDYEYVSRLEYDKFDQRVFLQYGNKTRTRYSYNDYTRRLAGLKAGVGAGQGKLFQELTYDYDNVGNILGQANHAAIKSPSEMGGATQFKYQYDDLYRLVHAEGIFDTQPDKRHTYRLDMQYNSIHNILLKDQLHELKKPKTGTVVQTPTTYRFEYQYAGSQPHAPTQIGTKTYRYDANGNQTNWTDSENGTWRQIFWDEENRVQRMIDNNNEKTYQYNDVGERIIKVSTQGETVYVNQFFVIRNGSVATKHIFAGSSRLVSKLAKQENPTIKGQNQGQTAKTGGPNEQQMYYYHPDHLGSSSYVTDSRGKVFQHLEYFPFGETWVEESSDTQRTPYLFTAKELDEETGLYYFGARYYDGRTSVWVSGDPILEKYLPTGDKERDGKLPGMGGVFSTTNLSLYHYAGMNPVIYIDPDGNNKEKLISKFVMNPNAKYALEMQKYLPGTFLGLWGLNNEPYHKQWFFFSDLVSVNKALEGDLSGAVDNVGYTSVTGNAIGPGSLFQYDGTPEGFFFGAMPLVENFYNAQDVYRNISNTNFLKRGGYNVINHNCQDFIYLTRPTPMPTKQALDLIGEMNRQEVDKQEIQKEMDE